MAATLACSAALIPLVYLIIRAGERGPAYAIEVVRSGRSAELLVNTVVLVVLVTAASVVVGVALAWLTVRTDLPGAPVVGALLCVPLAMPSYVLGYLWVADFPQFLGLPGSVIVLTISCYPYVFLPAAAALRAVDPGLEEVARTLGRGSVRAVLGVTLRQIRPAVAAGALLVALYTLSDFGAVAMLRYEAFTVGIYHSYRASFDRVPAAVLACVLILVALVVMVGERRARRGEVARVGAGVDSLPDRVPLGRFRTPALVVVGFVLTGGVLAPLVGLVRWVRAAAEVDVAWGPVLAAAATTAGVSGIAALVTIVLALPIGILAARSNGPVARATEAVAQIGFALPGITVGLAVVFVGIRLVPGLYQQLPMLVFGYVVLFLPLAVGVVRSAIGAIPTALEDASGALGSGRFRTFLRVVAPLSMPGVLAGGSLVFLSVAKELPATLLLRPTGTETLASAMWAHTEVAAYSQAAPYAAMLVAVAVIPAAVLGRSFGWGAGGSGRGVPARTAIAARSEETQVGAT
ncbi:MULTISPECIES: ABC transporter permease [Dietzia]|uniref:Iron ABC transporter permease n=1 Tax=Dietzia cercidiphylli TaxID=498199 RepID=A0ABN2III3_9ACTN|nr:iron ABC transporter permease [Dietzia cercidiphylli]MCT1515267.1 iron ABC transporter permease [Dietzia cercidiphylli]